MSEQSEPVQPSDHQGAGCDGILGRRPGGRP